MINRFRQFLGEVNIEARKVVWPNRKELIASTTVVIVTALLVAIFIGLLDFVFSKLISLIIR
ncbi:preprotein translocase subunit SecE [Candidatus Desantisbacteria bacterium CG07_land_8_20_14_0_80_39_15]|uniref:Protein translocase subunit SecE n=2 Tax=unclassified Candidatus Desantisiibacteriota TaxID=3106372 RepID=A0A2H9PCK9_9BACT|nr:MAG: preprotein translocase subunit SecE [Candidatus Desantisbacteria bacterium CG07_land_8_20_14_0_80_39_15]PIZ16967.1 MAG: preprotein translocase subunit SecE [Candidatus Desantisbacteria bacterium CG_4_10_14_0_8_um_filter_39_17]